MLSAYRLYYYIDYRLILIAIANRNKVGHMKEGIEKIYFYPASNVENCGLVGKVDGGLKRG